MAMSEKQRQTEMAGRLVGVRTIARLINEAYGLDEEDEIADATPPLWWHRTRNEQISLPMPDPDYLLGDRCIWIGAAVIVWYAQWKEIAAPKWARRHLETLAGGTV